MKRSVFSLVALILTFLVSVTARAGSGDVITSLSQLSQSKCYTISTVRGKMVLNTGKTGVVSSHTGGGATVNSNASTDEADGHWAIIVSGSSYYLYNVTKGEFLSSGNTFTAAHATLSISSAASPSGNYVYVIKSGASTLTNDDAGKVSFVAATTESEGTRVCITEAGDFDADAFATTSKSNLSSLLSTAKSAVSGYKTSIQDGDYYAGTDANHGLKSHYFVDGTEKTSQKGYECTQTQIDALSAAISSAETVSESSDATVAGVVEAYTKLATAKAVCDKKWDPVVDGVYFIINGFADDAPVAAQALKYGEEDEVLYKRPLVTSEPKQMFEVKVLSWDIDSDGDSIPTSAYIKNIASGKYLGGVDDNRNTFSDTPVAISWPVANTQGRTKQAHRYQFQTPTGELFNGQNSSSGCEVKTSGNYEWHRSWMFRPAEKYYQDYLANKDYNDYKNTVLAALAVPTAKEDGDLFTNSWIDGTERTAVAGFETTQERLDTLQAAWDKYDADRTDANKAAVDAAMEQVNKKWEPLTSGVYFLIPRFGDDQGNNNTQAMTYKDNAAWKLPLVKTNPAFMFEVNITSTDEDLDYGEVPVTMTIKNVANGKYLGAINGSAWEYQDDPVDWSYTTFVGSDFFSPSKHAHCFGLNIDGKFITYANNTAGSALTTTGSGTWAWYRAWMFRPAGKYYTDYMANKDEIDKQNILAPALESINSAITPANHHDNTGSRSFLLGNEKTSVDGLATSKDALDSLKAAYAVVDTLFKAGKKADEITAEINALQKAKALVDAKSNPLTDGYYYIISEYADDTDSIPGGYAIQYGSNTSNPDYAYKKPYKKNLTSQIFYVEYDKSAGKVYLKNIQSNKYLGKVENNAWKFVSEKTPLNIVSGTSYNWHWSAEKTKAARSCSFIITDDDAQGLKSSTKTTDSLGVVSNVTASSQAWTLAWAFRPAAYAPSDQHGWAMQYTRIKTPYADQVKPDSVLQEYPRPQMERENNWINLNGLWSFIKIDSLNQPLPMAGYKDILVPFCIESAMSGIKRHYENMIYRRNITIPAEWTGKRILLNFGAVDWRCKVEVNGHLAGEHEGGYDPFSLDITDYVEAGKSAEVIVRVYDPTDAMSVPRGKQVRSPRGIFYTACSGIWQTVWMEAVNKKNYIKDFTITPNIDDSTVAIKVVGASADASPVKISILRGETVIAEKIASTGDSLSIAIAHPDLWSPDHPYLYNVKFKLLDGSSVIDEVKSYFGMRKISIKKDKQGFVRMMLNNQFVFQMGPLDQGYWPESNLTPPSDAAIQNDIRTMKQMGFNMVRKHIKIEPARWYYWTDKLGLLVWQDMPSMNYGGAGGVSNDATIFTKELTAMIHNLKNVTSIINWVVFNEGGGQHNTAQYVKLVRSLDPSRLIDEASGWTHTGNGDIKDIHPYPAPSYTTSSTQATACGEYGGVKYGIKDHVWSGSGWGYATVTNAQEYDENYTEFSNMLAKYKNTKGLSAAVYTQLTDVETELNGLMTYDRIVKSDINAIRKANLIAIEGTGTDPDYLLPTAEVKPMYWRYVIKQPADNWYKPGFKETSWLSGKAGFGQSTPNVNTPWKTSEIWLRKNVKLNITKDEVSMLRGRIFNDEDVEVYINGILAYSATGYLTSYKNIHFNQAALDSINPQGTNLFAIHVKQTTGGQYIDLGLFLDKGAIPEPKTREVVVNMDYTKSSAVSVKIGYSTNLRATEPDVWHEYTRLPLDTANVGLVDDLLKQPVDLHYNITTLTQSLAANVPVKYFVYVNTTAAEAEGTAYDCQLIDYTSNPEGNKTDLMTEDTKALTPNSSILLTGVIYPEGIKPLENVDEVSPDKIVDVYSIDGKKIKSSVKFKEAAKGLAKGLYIIGNKVYKI